MEFYYGLTGILRHTACQGRLLGLFLGEVRSRAEEDAERNQGRGRDAKHNTGEGATGAATAAAIGHEEQRQHRLHEATEEIREAGSHARAHHSRVGLQRRRELTHLVLVEESCLLLDDADEGQALYLLPIMRHNINHIKIMKKSAVPAPDYFIIFL